MYAKKAAAMQDDKKQEKDKLIRNSFTLDDKTEMERICLGKGAAKNRCVVHVLLVCGDAPDTTSRILFSVVVL